MDDAFLIIKKSGNIEPWDDNKIIVAVTKSADRVCKTLSETAKSSLLQMVQNIIFSTLTPTTDGEPNMTISVETVHNAVELALDNIDQEIANSYREYRNWVKKTANMMQEIYEQGQSILNRGDSLNNDAVSNANADATLCSTQSAKIRDYLLTKQYEEYFLNAEEKKAAKDGYIYPHDKNLRLLTMNCCVFDVKEVLSGGFEMGNIWYNEPKRLNTTFDVCGDIILGAASQQYGGFTIPRVDFLLEKYAEMSYQMYCKEYMEIKNETEMTAECDSYAEKKVIRDFEQGFQGWEYKFNTVASSRGDYPFISITFGLQNTRWGKICNKAILKVRREGQGKDGHKKPVLFPKLIFLYDENLHGKGKPMEDVFEEGVLCSSKTMYPDWLSLTGNGYVSEMYKKYNQVVSPMGCRAFLSPWYPEGGMEPAYEGEIPVFEGRFNLGVVSLNLPLILAKSQKNCTDFYQELDYYMEMIRNIHKKTYRYLANKKASINPLGFCEGGFYGGHLKINDKIAPVLKSATASFGITALNELQQLYNQKSIRENGKFAYDVMEYINKKINIFKKNDHILYAIYGSPAESLCETQVKQFRKLFGIVENVSDRLYVTNSFHCHVTEDMSPIEKQDKEERFWDLFNGGKIQYCKYPLRYNIESMKTLIRRAMKKGLYEGVNLSLAYCDDCGYEQLEMDVCPKCGSHNLTKIDRMNGYLAYSRIKGDTRLNKGKMAEIADRKSM